MNDEQKTVPRPIRRLTVGLDTLLLIMTLIAVAVAYYMADQNREAWQSRLGRLETAIGLPRVRDIRNIEVAAMREDQGWSIWVPSGRTVKLSLAVEDLDSSDPPIERECGLKSGRNILRFYKPSQQPSAALLLNNEQIFARDFSRLWNIQSTVRGSTEFQTVNDPTRFFQSFSNVRLEVDEPFDPVKHRSGLQIWIRP